MEIAMGRPPIGKTAMTGTERVRRHRDRLRNSKPWLDEQARRVRLAIGQLERRLADIERKRRAASRQATRGRR
jgi:hypothetical protein